MNYIKAKFPKSTRSYVYRTEDSVKAGDTVVNAKGARLTVTDESVDMKWVETYGADKVAFVKKYEEYRCIDMVIKTKRFYVNGKSCKVELKKEGADYIVVVDGNVYAKTPNELYAVQKFNEI